MSKGKKTCPLNEKVWGRFVADELSETERASLLVHLKKPCGRCEEFLIKIGEREVDGVLRDKFSSLFSSAAYEKTLDREKQDHLFSRIMEKSEKTAKEKESPMPPDEPKKSKIQELLEARERIEMELSEALMEPLAVMFTDIKGSTTFFEKRGDLAGLAMVEKHNKLLFPVVEKHGGVVVKTIGDAIMARFSDPGEAAQAAIEMQTRLKEYNTTQPAADNIHIRIGVNWGRGMLKDNDVFGDVVNVAARVESVCEPDQILLSESIYHELAKGREMRIHPYKRQAVRGKEDVLNIYRLLWHDQEEMESDEPVEQAIEPPVAAPRPAARISERGLILYFHATLVGDKIQASLSEKRPGEEAAVRASEDIKVSMPEINDLSETIYSLLQKSTSPREDRKKLLSELDRAGGELFEKLFPPTFRKRLKQSIQKDMIISIDDHLVHVPWELCHDGKEFLGLRFNLGRVVSTHQEVREEKRRKVSSPLSMLVIYSGSKELAGAREESQRMVEEVSGLDMNVAVNKLFSPKKPKEILDQLSGHDIIHFSGHSTYNPEDPETSGWDLERGRLEARSVFEIKEGPMPALVFSNSCQSGQTAPWRDKTKTHRSAFSLANAFLLNGVQHFIGSFHDVFDSTSVDMGIAFYRLLLQGRSVGEALRSARGEVIESHGEQDLTWASYVLYGDPTTAYIRHLSSEEKTFRVEEVRRAEAARGKAPERGPAFLWGLVGGLIVLALVLVIILLKPWAQKPDPVAPLVALVNAGDWDQARSRAQALADGKHAERALYALAVSFLDADNPAGAKPYLDKLAEQDPEDPGLIILTAQQAMARGETAESRASLNSVLETEGLWSWQKARAKSLLARLEEGKARLDSARTLYEEAIALDPGHYQALTNLALLSERQGDFNRASSLFARAKQVRKDDPVLQAFSRENEDRIALRGDPERRARIMALIKDISAAADQKPEEPRDPWTSRPLTMSVMGIKTAGGVMAKSGQAGYLEIKLHELFEQSPLPVVERRALEMILEEMELSRTKLTDPETAVRVGRLLAARYIVTGELTFIGSRVEVGLRVVETETSLVKASFSEGFETSEDYLDDVRAFLEKITSQFLINNPVRGRVAAVMGDELVLNIGGKVGLKQGSKLNVYKEEDVRPLKKSGRIVAYIEPPAPLAKIEVTQVEPELSHAKVTVKSEDLTEGMMVSLEKTNQ